MPRNQEILQHFQSRGSCPYLTDRRASLTDYLLFEQNVDPVLYGVLIRNGWRRYGNGVYRMLCPDCRLCIPLRIQAASIHLSLSLKRILLLNRDLRIVPRASAFTGEHYLLWRKYSLWKHSSPPDELDEASYCRLSESWSLLFEYRENSDNEKLLALSHVDPLTDGLSSVYFSFAPEAKARSLGFFSMLAEAYIAAFTGPEGLPLDRAIPAEYLISFYTDEKILKLTRSVIENSASSRNGTRRYYYLGFWVPGAPKMDYKARIRPFELAIADRAPAMGGVWRRYISKEEAMTYLRKENWPGL